MPQMTRKYSSLVPFADGSGWGPQGDHYGAMCDPLALHAYDTFTVECSFVDTLQLVVTDAFNQSSVVNMTRARLIAGRVQFTALREDLVGKADLSVIVEFLLISPSHKGQYSNFTGSRTRSASVLSIGATI